MQLDSDASKVFSRCTKMAKISGERDRGKEVLPLAEFCSLANQISNAHINATNNACSLQ